MIKRILIVIGVILSLLLIGVYFSYDYWLEKELKYQLSEIISKDPNSLYHYSFEELDIDLLDGSVDLSGIIIEPKDIAYDSLKSDESSVRFLLRLHMEKIELIQFEIFEFINTKKIVVESLNLIQPSFSYYFHPGKKKATQKMPLSQVFSDKFKSAHIKNFVIIDGNVEVDNYKNPDPALIINYLDVDLTDAYVDKETLKRVEPIDYVGIELVAGSISADISKDFSIVSDSLLFDASDESFIIRDFQIKPKYNQENFAKLYTEQKQWFALTLGSVAFRKIDLEHFVHSGELKLGKIRIRKPNVALYKDKRKPEPPFKKKPLPATAISSIPIKISVDSLELINGHIAVNETSKLTGLDSHVSFHNLNGLMTNFTNFEKADRNSDILELNATALMYQQALIKLNMKFDLTSTLDQFSASGSVGTVELTSFNPVLEPMMAAKATEGTLHALSFQFDAMDTMSIGTLDMNYSNAKIEVLPKDTASTKQKKGFMSFAANTIIKKNNDITKPSYIQGVIKSKRVLNKDVWPFLWHSLQSGIISTMVPITNKKDVKHQQKERKQELKEERKGDND